MHHISVIQAPRHYYRHHISVIQAPACSTEQSWMNECMDQIVDIRQCSTHVWLHSSMIWHEQAKEWDATRIGINISVPIHQNTTINRPALLLVLSWWVTSNSINHYQNEIQSLSKHYRNHSSASIAQSVRARIWWSRDRRFDPTYRLIFSCRNVTTDSEHNLMRHTPDDLSVGQGTWTSC